MIAVALDPILARRVTLKDLDRGKFYEAEEVFYIPEGGGINTGRMVGQYGEDITVLGFLGGQSGIYAKEFLDRNEINSIFVRISSDTKNAISIVTEDGLETKILEPSPYVSSENLKDFYKLYRDSLKGEEGVSLSGTIPKGCPKDVYRDLFLIAKDLDKKVYLSYNLSMDRAIIEEDLDLLVINRLDLEEVYKIRLDSYEDIINLGRSMVEARDTILAIEYDLDIYYVFHENRAYILELPYRLKLNRNNCNDGFLAGFIISQIRNYDFDYGLRLGAASALASGIEYGEGFIDMVKMKEILSSIDLTVVEFKEE